jgi:hypothetical protein
MPDSDNLPAIIELKEIELAEQENRDIRIRALYNVLPWAEVFLQELRKCPVVGAAAEAAGVNRAWVHRAHRKFPMLAELWDEAIDDGCDKIEKAFFDRAVTGYDTEANRKYSDTAAIVLLKRHRPHLYRESFDLSKAMEKLLKAGREY